VAEDLTEDTTIRYLDTEVASASKVRIVDEGVAVINIHCSGMG